MKKIREKIIAWWQAWQHPREEQRFLEDSDLANLTVGNQRSHVILLVAVAFIVLILIWAYFAKLEEATSGTGKVIPSGQVQVVQNLEGGIVKKILVREGDVVTKGQVLVQIDDTNFAAQYREGVLKATVLKLKVTRLTAEAAGSSLTINPELKKAYPDLARNEVALFSSRANRLKAKLTTLEKQKKQVEHELKKTQAKQKQLAVSLKLVQRELGMTRPLVKHGAVSKVEVLRLERQVNDLAGELKDAELSVPRLEEGLAEAQSKIKELMIGARTEALKELNTAEALLASQIEENRALQDRFKRTMVRSPVNGTVKVIKVTTIGGVVKPGMDLMEIVPKDATLLIEAKILPSDVAFLRPGQKAMVKFTAYDFSIYGGLAGILEHISADTIKDEKGISYYLIRVRTNKAYLGSAAHPLPIIAGMTAEVDILTGEKSVLDYLLKPILKTKQKALRER